MDPTYSDPTSPSATLRRRRQHSPLSLSSCFTGGASAPVSSDPSPSLPSSSTWSQLSSPSTWSQLSSPSTWLRSKAHDLKYRTLSRNHRRHHSAEFRYDPLSYSLNFDEGGGEADEAVAEDNIRYRAFSSRLPASPPRPTLQSITPGREAPV